MTGLGIALLIVGVVLLVAEAHIASAGALGIAGVIALAAGGAWLAIASGVGVALALPVAAGLGATAAAALLVASRKATEASRLRVTAGSESLVGCVGKIRSPLDPVGQVMVAGALWRARRGLDEEVDGPLERGDRVIVEKVDGLTLSVRRAEEWEETGC